MAVCYSCNKKKIIGHNVSHANNKTKRIILPNLQRVKIFTDKGVKRTYVCTRCLRSNKVVKAL
ncbi:MAG: 50S ribosomal protein L28 [Thermodesulfovibrionales bacterium]|nr:50S ribosomal protein L28 [Thermodesulfovibrionales bacterium]